MGLLAFATNVWGNILLTRKSERGWWVRIVSIVLWFIYARNTSSLAMTANSVTFFGINCYGMWKWRKERKAFEASRMGDSPVAAPLWYKRFVEKFYDNQRRTK